MIAGTAGITVGFNDPVTQRAAVNLVVLNDSLPFTTDDSLVNLGHLDVESVVLHELGHALGLGHNKSGTVMRAGVDPVTKDELRQLGIHDAVTDLLAQLGMTEGDARYFLGIKSRILSREDVQPLVEIYGSLSEALATLAQPSQPTAPIPNSAILTFESFGIWKPGNQKWGKFTQTREQIHSGQYSGKFEYAIPKVPHTDSYFVFQRSVPIPGQPNAFQIWVYGDGEGNFLNIWVRDRKDRKWQFTFGRVTHKGVWQQMTAYVDLSRGWPNEPVDGKPFPAEGIVYPLKLDALVIDGVDETLPSAGVIYVDDLTAATLPNTAMSPVSPPAQPAPVAAAPVAPPQSPAPLNVVFQSDRTSINVGECVNLRWDVTEVNGVWLNDQGVPGQSSQQVCPAQTQEFKLKIQRRDGGFEERSITIQVSGNPQPPAANPPPAPAPVDTGYGTLGVIAADTRRPPEGNPDLNLSLLGYQPNGAAADYKDYGSPDDSLAPQLRGLFADRRRPTFTTAFINNGWDWGSNTRTPPSPGQYEATVIGVAVSPGESLFTPGSGRTIGNDYSALVLYADANQITLKYTPEDSIARGYTVFIEGINVNPQLLAVYQTSNAAGRGSLPALRAGQLLGTAHGSEIRLAIRDNATFMDPRSLQDWWR